MILLDYGAIQMANFMPRPNDFLKDPNLYRHQMINTIRMINSQRKHEYGELVICMDARNNWRRKVFPQYKANRKVARGKAKFDMNEAFEIMGQTRDEIIENMPFKSIMVDTAEADDIIGVLAAHHGVEFGQIPPILIVSPDHDFLQLQRFTNVKQWSNMKRDFIISPNPGQDLLVKIFRGDTGDGVPNILSDDDTLVNPDKRQGVVTKKRVTEWLNGTLGESMTTQEQRRFVRNKNLIDLTQTPKELQSTILEAYNKPQKNNINDLMAFFMANRMNLMMESLDDFSS